MPAGQGGDGFKEGRSGVEQSDAVFRRVSGGQLAVRDELAEGGPAGLVIQVVVDAVAVGKEGQPAGERIETVAVGVGWPADVPAQAARAGAGEHGARLPALAQDLRQAVRAPDGDEVHHAAALDQDHVLVEQVGPDVGHARLGEQPQDAELDVVAIGEPCRVVVDGILPVTDSGRDVAQPPHGPVVAARLMAKLTSAPGGGPPGWGFRIPENAKIRRCSVLTDQAYEPRMAGLPTMPTSPPP